MYGTCIVVAITVQTVCTDTDFWAACRQSDFTLTDSGGNKLYVMGTLKNMQT